MTDSSERPLAVFDPGNTLADTAHRQRFLESTGRGTGRVSSRRRRWIRRSPRACLVLESARQCEIVYLTGRPERCRRDTREWLAAQGLPEGRVFMRRDTDRRGARYTKLEILRRLGREREIRVLVDDDKLVCEGAERAGFTVVRARWAVRSAEPEDAQEREGRT